MFYGAIGNSSRRKDISNLLSERLVLLPASKMQKDEGEWFHEGGYQVEDQKV